MIIQLYETAMRIMGEAAAHDRAEETKLSALETICATLDDHFCKISSAVASDPATALKYAENRHEYCARLKRKYQAMSSGNG